jgi:two-component system, cell cycle response regulator
VVTGRDELFTVASERGELLVAKIRLLLASTLLLIPLSGLLFDLQPGEGLVGLIITLTGVAFAFGVYFFVRRNRSWPWLGLATSALDVTLVSAALATFLVLGQPHTAVNSKVVFEAYFLAIGATCLRHDRRACVVAGIVAVVEYFVIVWIAATFWDLNDVDRYGPFIYGAFNWSAQVSRLILLVTASVLSIAVVTRTRELVRLSTRDALTGLYNRGYFHERVAIEVSRATRVGAPLAIAMIDVDHFKSFNDTHGHAAGDRVLQTIAAVLRRSFRVTDVVSRYGGEEFVIAMPGTDTAAASRKLEIVRQGIESSPMPMAGGKTVRLTISAGVAGLPTDGTKEEELLAVADARLFQAKNAGRNMIVETSAVTARN